MNKQITQLQQKVCSRCPENGKQSIDKFQRFIRKRYGREEICYTPYCKKCKNKAAIGTKIDWENHKKAIYKWRAANKDKVAKYAKKWYSNNSDIAKDKNKQWYKKYSTELPDWYLSIQIARNEPFTRYDVPTELIEIKRKQLKLKRDIKNGTVRSSK